LTRAKRPRAQAQEPGTVWTIAQLRAFLATARQHRLFVFFHVAAYTGARRGELLNLRWTDIDLDAKKITVTGSTAVIGGERVNGTTKSGRTRVVSIDDETVAVLRLRRADQAAEQLQAGDSWRGTKGGYVFTTGWGEPVYPDTVTSLMAKLIHATTSPTKVLLRRTSCHMPGYTTSGTCTRRPCQFALRRPHACRCGPPRTF
jgi:integrase